MLSLFMRGALAHQPLATAAAGSTVALGNAALRAYHVARLASRGVISVTGADGAQFLQGMTTNDMRPLEQQGAGPVYAVLLTAKGKYLHDLFAYNSPDGATPRLLLDIDAAGIQSALAWLSKYKLRRQLTLADVSNHYNVWAAFEGELRAGGAGQWRQDPRLPALGLRGLFDAQQLPPPPASGSGSRKQQAAGMSVVSEDHFRQFRFLLGVAEGDTEIPSGEVAPLECNLDALSGISYNKGCYIGQERNSYTHYRGVIRKRMMPVLLPGLAPSTRLACPLPIVALAPGRKGAVGVLTSHAGDVGMAHIKLAPALAAAAAGEASELRLQLEGSSSSSTGDNGSSGDGDSAVERQQQRVVPFRPGWWPSEWGREEL